MENHVAGGKTFSWEIRVKGNPIIKSGATGQLEAVSIRMGKDADHDYDHPVSYIWESSDTNVADVGMDGSVFGVTEGTCTVTCTLEQNRSIREEYEITVVPVESGNEVAFLGNIPDKLRPYESVTIEAAYFENGEERLDKITFSYSGADAMSYTATEAGNSTQITCWSASDAPLNVTATFGEYTASVEIGLEGI